MKSFDTAFIGRFGENIAEKLLRKKGYKILGRNYRVGKNEIDIIAENKEYTVFVEVKTRSEHCVYGFEYGNPADAVDIPKQRRTAAAADAYLYKRNGYDEHDRMVRFDIIEVYLRHRRFSTRPSVIKVEHIEDAFSF